MKWSERIAQGFNPGLDVARRALKVATEVRVFRWFCPSIRRQARTSGATFRALCFAFDPGLKPWAILSNHFMVKNQLPRILNTPNQGEHPVTARMLVKR